LHKEFSKLANPKGKRRPNYLQRYSMVWEKEEKVVEEKKKTPLTNARQ